MRLHAIFVLALALSAPVFAQEHAVPTKAKTATLMAGLGEWRHPVSTKNAQAQAFFDQGLRLIYAFNHDEAARSFQHARELDPKLAVAPTVVMPPIPMPQMPTLGDLKSAQTMIASNGTGSGAGIGSGGGTGVGMGFGPGVGQGQGGGIGGGLYRVGGGVSAPRPLYDPEPEYSEEARKARYQGTVVLEAIVRRDGTVDIQRIVRSLGFGLDENAIQALKQWRFRPGMRNGVPVDVSLNIEVNFNLR